MPARANVSAFFLVGAAIPSPHVAMVAAAAMSLPRHLPSSLNAGICFFRAAGHDGG